MQCPSLSDLANQLPSWLYRCLAKKGPWAVHITLCSDRGVGRFLILSPFSRDYGSSNASIEWLCRGWKTHFHFNCPCLRLLIFRMKWWLLFLLTVCLQGSSRSWQQFGATAETLTGSHQQKCMLFPVKCMNTILSRLEEKGIPGTCHFTFTIFGSLYREG